MAGASSAFAVRGSHASAAIFWAGLISAVLDLTHATVTMALKGMSVVQVLQYVASGVLGPSSFKGGLSTAALGLLLHLVIAFGAASVYYAASRKFPVMVNSAIPCGLIYGIGVYLFMSRIVLPLSAVPKSPVSMAAIINSLLAHMALVGLPIALVVRRFSRQS